MRWLVAALVLLIASPAMAQGDNVSASVPPAASTTLRAAAQAAAAQTTEATEREADLAHRKEIFEARAALEDAGQTRLQVFGIYLSAMIGLFGIAITIAVLVLSFRVERAAVDAAKNAAVDAVRNEIRSEKVEIEALLREARSGVEGIKAQQSEAAKIIAGLRPGEKPATEAERQIVEDAAAVARKKPPAERTLDDLRALLIDSFEKANWHAMRDYASAILYLYDADPWAAATGLFNLAYANDELKRADDAIAAYAQLIARFGTSDDAALRKYVAKALVNKGVALRQQGKWGDAINDYDDVITRFGTSDDPALRERVAKALVNRGFALGKQGKFDDAITSFDDVIARFGTNDDPALRELVAKALFNKGNALRQLDRPNDAMEAYGDMIARYRTSDAHGMRDRVTEALFNRACLLALGGEAAPAIAGLRQWAAFRGSFGCAAVQNDAEFDPIRADPAFVAFMAELGCTPPA